MARTVCISVSLSPRHSPRALVGTQLGLRLPADYIHSLIHYPFPVDSPLAEEIFYPNPAKIVEVNEYYRREGFYGHVWPKQFLVIGSMGNFNPVFLDTGRGDSLILVADHEQSADAGRLVIEEFQSYLLPQWLEMVEEGWQEFGNHER
jgi:hypothetical protein